MSQIKKSETKAALFNYAVLYNRITGAIYYYTDIYFGSFFVSTHIRITRKFAFGDWNRISQSGEGLRGGREQVSQS